MAKPDKPTEPPETVVVVGPLSVATAYYNEYERMKRSLLTIWEMRNTPPMLKGVLADEMAVRAGMGLGYLPEDNPTADLSKPHDSK